MGTDPVSAACDDPLSYYESIAAASARMLRAAQRSDWDSLIAQEKICAALIEKLRAADANRRLHDGNRQRKAAIIRQVLEEDAEIRRLTQPWLRRVEGLLRSSTNQLRLGDAYR
jgi:flagellar protein FliT